MYSRFQFAKKYLHYYLTASNGKGHGIHSPFVYDFIINVLNAKKSFASEEIENVRYHLLRDDRLIEVNDLGAGSSKLNSQKRYVKDIAVSSLKQKKYAALLAAVAGYYKSKTIIELGTSLGITTSYISQANPDATIYTIEGSENIAQIALDNFSKLNLQNINLLTGNFDIVLPELLQKINNIDFVFVDGNHRKEPSMQYFKLLLKKINSLSILIFDDIHWSAEMEEAWELIKNDAAVTLSIDLFFIGLVFFRTDFKYKQHFTIRF